MTSRSIGRCASVAALVLPVLAACAGQGFSRVENPFFSSFYDRSAVDRAFRDTKMPVVIARPLGGIEASTGEDVVLEALERGYPRQSAGFTRVAPPEGTVPDGYYLVVQPDGNVTNRPDACTPRAIHMTDTGAPPPAAATAPSDIPHQIGLAICYGDSAVSVTQGSMVPETANAAGYAPLFQALFHAMTPLRNPMLDNGCIGFCNDARLPSIPTGRLG
ncbi:hypothetical protein P7L78_13775 [Tistrella bauzanensis]|uniref:hypothetical protein n=1 Tax=Tistrella TaxID=171436 RepID=UPI0031F648FD